MLVPFRARLVKLRVKLGMTQKDLASITGFQPSHISQFERGNRKPSCKNLVKLADGLDTTVDYLLCRTDEPHGFKSSVTDFQERFAPLNLEDKLIVLALIDIMVKRGNRRHG